MTVTPGSSSLAVSWSAPTSAGSASVSNYQVSYSTDLSSWTVVSRPASTVLSATIAGLSNGTLYYVRVAAITSVGMSEFSTAASATPVGVPTSPTSLTLTGGINQVVASWIASDNTNGSPIVDYSIQYKLSSSSSWLSYSHLPSTATSATISPLVAGGYDVRVAAVNGVGTSSYTASLSASVVSVPTSPTTLSATPSASQIVVSWAAPASNGGLPLSDYLVQYSENGTDYLTYSHAPSTATSATITGLNNSVAYSVRVAAINSAGTSPFASLSSTTLTLPTAPSSVTVTPGSSSLAVSWSAPASAGSAPISDYLVSYSTDLTSWVSWSHVASTARTATVTNLTNGTAYFVRVAAVSSVGASDFSSIVSFTPVGAPLTPSGLAVSWSSNNMSSTSIATLSWSAPSSGGSPISDYNVEYSTNGSSWSSYSHVASTATSASISLASGPAYYFRVSARNALGTSTAATLSSVVSPPASGCVGRVYTSFASASTYSLNVTANPSLKAGCSDGFVGASSLSVQVATDAAFSAPVQIASLSSLTADQVVSSASTTWAAETTLYVRIVASNSAGTTYSSSIWRAATGVSAATYQRVVTPPKAPSAVAASCTDAATCVVSFSKDASSSTTSTFSALLNTSQISYTCSTVAPATSCTSTAPPAVLITPQATASADTSVNPCDTDSTNLCLSATATGSQVLSPMAAPPVTQNASVVISATVNAVRYGDLGTLYLDWGTSSAFNAGTYSTKTTATQNSCNNCLTSTGTSLLSESSSTRYYFRWRLIVGSLTATSPTTVSISAPAKPDSPTISTVPSSYSSVANGLQVTFTAPAASTAVPLTDYLLQYSTDGFATTSSFAHTLGTGLSGSTTVTITGLVKNQCYDVRIAFISLGGTSPSNLANYTCVASTPSAPSVSATAISGGSATISWATPASNSATITGYTVLDNESGRSVTVSSSSLSTVFTGLSANTTHTFYVYATSDVGNGASGVAYASAYLNAPSVPYGVTTSVVGASLQYGAVVLSWSAPVETNNSSVTGYSIRYRTAATSSTHPSAWLVLVSNTVSSATTYTVTGLTPGVKYEFSIAAISAGGTSAWSPVNTTTTVPGASSTFDSSATPVKAPANVVASKSASSTVGSSVGCVDVSWSAGDASYGAIVYWKISTGIWAYASNSGFLAAGTQDYTACGLSEGTGTAYDFKVESVPAGSSSSVMPAASTTTASSYTVASYANPNYSLVNNPVVSAATNGFTVTYAAPSTAPYGVTYMARYRVAGSSTWVYSATTTGLSITVTGLPQGYRYEVQVAAGFSSSGSPWGSYSTAMFVTVASSTTIPSPSSVTYFPGGAGSAYISWSMPASFAAANITDYVVEYSTNNGASWTTYNDGVSTNTWAYLNSFLASSINIYVRVSAKSSSGYTSTPTSTSLLSTTYNTSLTPGVPSALTATVNAADNVTLSWTKPASTTNGSGYIVYLRQTPKYADPSYGSASGQDSFIYAATPSSVNTTSIVLDGSSSCVSSTTTFCVPLTRGMEYDWFVQTTSYSGYSYNSQASSLAYFIPDAPEFTSVDMTNYYSYMTKFSYTTNPLLAPNYFTRPTIQCRLTGSSSWNDLNSDMSGALGWGSNFASWEGNGSAFVVNGTGSWGGVCGTATSANIDLRISYTTPRGSSGWGYFTTNVSSAPVVTLKMNSTTATSYTSLSYSSVLKGKVPTSVSLYRAATGGTASLVSSLSGASGTFNDTSVVSGVTYSYYVVASYPTSGSSTATVNSNTVFTTSLAPSITGSVLASSTTTSTNLSWSATSNGAPISGYTVAFNSGGFPVSATLVGQTTYTIPAGVCATISANTRYSGSSSTSVCPPTPVVNMNAYYLTDSDGTVSNKARSVSVSWSVSSTQSYAVSGYVVQVYNSDTGVSVQTIPLASSVSSYTVSNLPVGYAYSIRVYATYSGGQVSSTVDLGNVFVSNGTAPGAVTAALASDYGVPYVSFTAPASTGGVAVLYYKLRTYSTGYSSVTTVLTVTSGYANMDYSWDNGCSTSPLFYVDITPVTIYGSGPTVTSNGYTLARDCSS